MRRLVCVLTAVGLGGCFYPADRGRALEVKLDRLVAENSELSERLKDEQRRALGRIDEKIQEVQKALDALDKAARTSSADIGVQLQKTVEDLAELRGQVETYLYRISDLDAKLGEITAQTEQRLLALKGPEAIKEAEAVKTAAELLKRPGGPKELLQVAEEQLRAGEAAVARLLFAEFIKRWPKEPLLGEAHFGLGETFYTGGKCREALAEYGHVMKNYGQTRSAPVAYLRAAECFKRLKMRDQAKLALEEVVSQYPKSAAAKTATKMLGELSGGGRSRR